MERRDFLKDAAAGAALVGLAGRGHGAPAPLARATVVQVHLAGSAAATGAERTVALEKMLAAGIAKLTGRTGEAAWKGLFKPDDVVALKVNCLSGRIATTVALADVVARGVLSAGVKGEHCLVYERSQRELLAAGYTMGPQPGGYRVVATDQGEFGWEAETTKVGEGQQRLTKIVTQKATALVSLPIVKDHNIAGVTGALKNHYGDIQRPGELHRLGLEQHIPALAALPPLRGKLRLVVGDALTTLYEGGPMNRPDRRHVLDCILLSLDPLAYDAATWKIIEDVRAAKGLPTLARAGREPTWLKVAAAAPYQLGIADPARIDVVRIEL